MFQTRLTMKLFGEFPAAVPPVPLSKGGGISVGCIECTSRAAISGYLVQHMIVGAAQVLDLFLTNR